MMDWLLVVLGVAAAMIFVLLWLVVLVFRSKKRTDVVVADAERCQSSHGGIARPKQVSPHDGAGFQKTNNYRASQIGRFFTWADHPSLVGGAVGNGWQRFAFTTLTLSPSVKSSRSMLGACAAASCDGGNPINVETGWEVCEGSANYMQRIRLNPGLKKTVPGQNSPTGAVSLIRTALPLPGPKLLNSSFPQEAYFEIKILAGNEDIHGHLADEEKDMSEEDTNTLIQKDGNSKNLDPLSRVTVGQSQRKNKVEEGKVRAKQGDKTESILLSVGLTGGGPIRLKIPGSHPGSIGFNSSGSVYLDGAKLEFESDKAEWGRPEQVIGCGYNPSQKKVFFTVDSRLVHELHCKTEEFGYPLHPTLAANADVTVLVNLGQSPFKFEPANMERTPNPHSVAQMGGSAALDIEDNEEFFSMRRIDSQWLWRSGTRSSNNTVNAIKSTDSDEDSDGDLFEIVLDVTGQYPCKTPDH